MNNSTLLTGNGNIGFKTLIAVGCLTLLVAPWLFGQSATRNLFADANAQIDNMSDSEFEQFQQNLAAYNRLSDDKKQQLRSLHSSLTNDPAQVKVATEFQKWLTTVSTSDQAKIKAIKETAERVETVARWKDKSRFPIEIHTFNVPNSASERMRSYRALAKDCSAFVETIGSPVFISMDEASDVWDTASRVLNDLYRERKAQPNPATGPESRFGKIDLTVAIPQFREPKLRKTLTGSGPEFQLYFISNVLREYFKQRNKLRDVDYEKQFAELTIEERDRLMQKDPETAMNELRRSSQTEGNDKRVIDLILRLRSPGRRYGGGFNSGGRFRNTGSRRPDSNGRQRQPGTGAARGQGGGGGGRQGSGPRGNGGPRGGQ